MLKKCFENEANVIATVAC